MNILHLNRFFYSGQTGYVFSLVGEQQRLGVNARLVMDGSPSYKALSVYKETIRELDVDVTSSGHVNTLLKRTREFAPQLIHAHSSLTFPLAAYLAKELKIPYVVTCHGLGLNRQEYKPYLQQARAILCISPRVAKTLHRYAEKITIVPNGLDLEDYPLKEKNDPIKVALISRVEAGRQKGYDHFCKAVDILEGVKFFVASNVVPKSKTAEYLGWPDNTSELLTDTDILAASGRFAMEGLAAGNALLILGRTFQGLLTPETTAKQPIPDLSGLTGSDPCYKTIFYDLAKLTQNQIYLRQLQQFCRELAEKEFCNKKLAKRTLTIYKNILHQR
ncbi:MAG: glycosyltransferase family 4 protein [Bacillota bacterium]|nr:glycosyltransferase family 4 protein [Bacillota bacterium]MDW7683136.1 glycosyltransferase family 4 protein [Bacillota bacterium]